MPLDAERAEHGSERQVEGLEHGALLDVELEVRGGRVELPAALEHSVEHNVVRRERVRQGDAVRVA